MSTLEQDFHGLTLHGFDELSQGEGAPGTIKQLRGLERSRRLLMLRALVDHICTDPELYRPLPNPDEAWKLLIRVEERDPDVLELVLANPYTGSWLAYATRLVHNGVSGVCPLWIHLGYFHALAASAAIQAGIGFAIRVPVWEGTIILPTLGVARLPVRSRFSVAEVRGMAAGCGSARRTCP